MENRKKKKKKKIKAVDRGKFVTVRKRQAENK
jgi:hypothetical protein